MDKTKWVLCSMLAAVLLLGWTSVAQADDGSNDVDPEAIAKACVAKMTHVANKCVVANEKNADRAVEKIGNLLAEGKVKKARRVAKVNIRRINRRSNNAVRSIRKIRNRGVRKLLKMGEKKLAARVTAAARQRVKKVNHSRAAAIAKIRRAFPSTTTDK